jgi:hypothetical protein
MKIRSSFKTVLITLSLMFFFNIAQAQPGFDDDVEDTPIDGWVIIFVCVSACYGVRSMIQFSNYQYSKKNRA